MKAKILLHVFFGMALVLAYGITYGEKNMSIAKDAGCAMISSEADAPADVDHNWSTEDKGPAGSEEGGAGAGGMTKDENAIKSDSDKATSMDQYPAAPGEERSDTGGASTDSGY